MNAIILEGINKPLTYTQLPVPVPGVGEVLIRLRAASFNHRDLWIQKGMYAGLRFPSIQGSDGCGIVEQLGESADNKWMGKEVVINPALNWGDNPNTQAKDFIILGMALDGTFAEYVKVNAGLLYEKPAHLLPEEAAALPLSGLTAYRALMSRAGVNPAENILVTGIGGGVALFCAQFAIAYGCNVYVTSADDNKISRAIELGAKGGVNYRKDSSGWHKAVQSMSGGFDAVIDSSGGDNFAKLVDICKPAGRIVMYGATLGAFNSGVPAKIFWKQLSVFGSTMGSDAEFASMIDFVNRYKIIPVIDSIYSLKDAQSAIQKMNRGEQFGKIVLKINGD